LLIERFGVPAENVRGFFDAARAMSHLDDRSRTTRELFEQFFPGRADVVRAATEACRVRRERAVFMVAA
jgi:hypothetical protein